MVKISIDGQIKVDSLGLSSCPQLYKIIESIDNFICAYQLVRLIINQVLKYSSMLNQSQLSTDISMTDPVQEIMKLLKDISLSLRKTRTSAECIFDVVKRQLPIISSSLYEVEENINVSMTEIAANQSSSHSNSIIQSNSHRSAREQRMDQHKDEVEQVGSHRGLAHYRQVSKLSLQQVYCEKKALKPQSQHEYRSQQAETREQEAPERRIKHQNRPFLPSNFFDSFQAIQRHLELVHELIGEDQEILRGISALYSKLLLLFAGFEEWPVNEEKAGQVIAYLKESVEKILLSCKLSRKEKAQLDSAKGRLLVIATKACIKAIKKSTQPRQQPIEK